MRLFILLLTFLAHQSIAFSQDKPLYGVFEYQRGLASYLGDNVYNYSSKAPRYINGKFMVITNAFTLGTEFKTVKATIKERKYIGNISSTHQLDLGILIGYSPIFNPNWRSNFLFSFGRSRINGQGIQRGNYVGLCASTKRKIFSQLYLSLGYTFSIYKYDITAPDHLLSFYKNSYIHALTVGLSIN